MIPCRFGARVHRSDGMDFGGVGFGGVGFGGVGFGGVGFGGVSCEREHGGLGCLGLGSG